MNWHEIVKYSPQNMIQMVYIQQMNGQVGVMLGKNRWQIIYP